MNKKFFIFAVIIFGIFLLFPNVIQAAIITCGEDVDHMCTLCDIVSGFNTIIQYLMKISIGVALLVISIGGILYTVSAGDSGAVETAKKAIKNGLIGFVIVFAAFIIVGTVIKSLGANQNLGISQAESWGKFNCTAPPAGP